MSSDHAMVCLKVKSSALSEATSILLTILFSKIMYYVVCLKKKKKAGTFNKIINPDRSSQFAMRQ